MTFNGDAPKILVRSPNWVGDAIMATPVIGALKKSMPHCTIHVLAKAWVSPVWSNHPDVSKVIPVDHSKKNRLLQWFSVVKQLRREHYNSALVLPNSFSSAWMVFWADIKKRIGYKNEGREFFLTKSLTWTKSHQQMARPQVYLNLTKHIGVDMDHCNQWQFFAEASGEATQKAADLLGDTQKTLVGIAPGSVAASRRWPVERYAGLIGLLREKGYEVVLLGSTGDRIIAEKVAKKAGIELCITAGKTDLDTGLAVIKAMDIVISNDSGAMHMAYAQNVPVLVLQGAADPEVTGPFGKNSTYIRNNDLSCAPCVKNECPKKHLKCMKTIAVEEVFKKTVEMLGK